MTYHLPDAITKRIHTSRASIIGTGRNLADALRTSNMPAIPAMTGSAPTTQAAAVDQLFAERAYWTWLTGHRLGDMRRLVRNYGRDAEAVFPTGTLQAPLVGSFWASTSIVIPFNERSNPNFTGCLDIKA